MPQYEWPGWLNIVMVIEQYRLRATATQFAVNRRWRAFGKEPLRLKTSFTEQRFNQVSHLRHTQTLGHYARLATEPLKQGLRFICMFIEIRYHRISHWKYLSTLISNFPGLRVATSDSPIPVLDAGFAACGLPERPLHKRSLEYSVLSAGFAACGCKARTQHKTLANCRRQ